MSVDSSSDELSLLLPPSSSLLSEGSWGGGGDPPVPPPVPLDVLGCGVGSFCPFLAVPAVSLDLVGVVLLVDCLLVVTGVSDGGGISPPAGPGPLPLAGERPMPERGELLFILKKGKKIKCQSARNCAGKRPFSYHCQARAKVQLISAAQGEDGPADGGVRGAVLVDEVTPRTGVADELRVGVRVRAGDTLGLVALAWVVLELQLVLLAHVLVGVLVAVEEGVGVGNDGRGVGACHVPVEILQLVEVPLLDVRHNVVCLRERHLCRKN